MQDFQAFPVGDARFEQRFFRSGASAIFEVWDKPRGVSFVSILAIGGGGGGGGGRTGIAGAARGGGGGGGAGGVFRSYVPAFILPDRLYVSVGTGSAGGGANTGGSAGVSSFVSLYPTTSGNGILLLTAGQGNGGQAGATSGSVNSGTGAAAALGSFFGLLGIWTVARSAVTSGGAATGGAGVDATMLDGMVTNGGGGGGTNGADAAGGGVTSPDTSWIPGVSGTAAGSNLGNSASWLWNVGVGMGGAGGGASNAGVGGGGGNGAYGCGGGGGGGGTTGGTGGRGGDGLVIIWAS